jgi:hypothetical protein
MKTFINKIFGHSDVSTTDGFSSFFRDASSAEKERVIGDAVRKSTEDQKALVERYHKVKTS